MDTPDPQNAPTVAFMQQAPAVSVGNVAPPASTRVTTVGDQQDFWDRWTFITTASWPSTSAYGTQIMNFDPITALLQSPSISRKFANFNRLTWDAVEVRIVMMTSQSQFGHLVFGAIPNGTEIYTGTDGTQSTSTTTTYVATDTLPNVQQLTHGLHGHMSPQTSAPLVFQLPWISSRDSLAIQDITTVGAWGGGHQSQWRILGIVVESLGNATDMAAIANGTFTVYARFRGMCLQSPVQFQSKKERGRVGKAADSVRSIASALKPLPIVGEIAEGVELVSSAVGAVADFFGFTRETNTTDMDRAVLFLNADLPFADGVDSGVSLSLLKGNKVSIDPAIAGSPGVDCEAFSDVLPREGLLTTTAWTTTQTVGTTLLGFGVCPTNYVWPTVGGFAYPTPAGWVGEHFEQWRGTMHYTVRVHASSFHRGLLQVVWNPTTFAPYAPAADPTNVSFNRIIEVKGDTVFHFTVGWQHPALFLRSALRSRGTNFNAEAVGFDNGMIHIRVAGELSAPDPAAALTVEIYQSADPDMVFANPCGVPDDFQFQAAEDEGGDSMDDAELVPGSPGDPTAVAMGETITSIRTLLQRPCFVGVIDGSAPVVTHGRTVPAIFGYGWVPFIQPRTVLGVGGFNNNAFCASNTQLPADPVSTLAPMFLGWRGSIRYKFILYPNGAYTDNTTDGVWNFTDAEVLHASTVSQIQTFQRDNAVAGTGTYGDTLGSATGTATYKFCGLALSGQWTGANCLEVTVPHYYPRKYTLVRVIPTSGVIDAGAFLSVRGTLKGVLTTAASFRVGRVLRSVGDDFSLVHFRFVPTIKRTV